MSIYNMKHEPGRTLYLTVWKSDVFTPLIVNKGVKTVQVKHVRVM